MELRYKLEVTDSETEEVIYSNTTFSMESLEEQDHKMQKAIADHIKKRDEGLIEEIEEIINDKYEG